MTDLTLFLLAVLTVLGTPGPTNTLLATSGATAGIRASLPLLLGELGGYLISIMLLRLVLGPVLASAPLLAIALKIAVAAYLVFVAVEVWRKTLDLTPGRAVTVWRVFVATLLNPKALIFALTIFPHDPPVPLAHLGLFAGSVALCGFGWIALGRALGAAAGRHAMRLIPRAAAVALASFAGFVLYSAFS